MHPSFALFGEAFIKLLDRAARPALQALLRRSLPTLEGAVALSGLGGEVEILRDRFGVPQVFAEDEHDLFFAQGYVHAQDRFFQMELQRRAGHGRLAELLGESALEPDRLARVMGFSRIAAASVAGDKLPEALRVLEAYSAGVNACVANEPRPPELRFLRHRPEPWTPADTAAWSLVMAWGLSPSWESKVSRSLAGSNAWAVAPSHSASGSALLAGDPHLALGIPCVWYEVGLYGGRYHVVGASLPGTPGVVIGHNQEIAWSITAALTDVQDLYAERFSETSSTLYEHQGEWLEAEVREEIKVHGRRKPVVQRVRTTLHGPVITDVAGGGKDLALQWATPKPLELVEAGLAVNRALNKEEFLGAVDGWQAPNQNFVYADRAGNIGWALAGPVPVRRGDRRGHRGDHPFPGFPGEHEWEGYLPFEELPRDFEPAEGFVASANEDPPDDRIPGAYFPVYRKARIEKLLRATSEHSLETFRKIQGDLYCAPAHALSRRLAKLPPPPGVSKTLIRELAAWDGALSARTRPGAVARVALEVLLRRAAEVKSRSGSPVPARTEPNLTDLIPELLDELDDLPKEDLQSALVEAVGIVAGACGPDPADWRWGALHVAQFRHPLGIVKALRGLLNRGPYPAGGDASTVRFANFDSGKPGRPSFGPVTTAPNYRFIVDVGDWDKAWSMLAPGQSGHPGSASYDDQIELWLDLRYRPMVFGRQTAELAASHRLLPRPARRASDAG